MSNDVNNNFKDYMYDIHFKYLLQENRLYLAYILSSLIEDITYDDVLKGVFLNSEIKIKNIKHKKKYLDLLFYIKHKHLYLLLEMNREESEITLKKNLNYLKEVSLWFQREDINNRYILINFDNYNKYSDNITNEYITYSKVEDKVYEIEDSKIIHINLAKIRKIKYTKSTSNNMMIRCLKMLAATNEEQLKEAIGDNKILKGVEMKMRKFIKIYTPWERTYKEELERTKILAKSIGAKEGEEQANLKTAKNMLKEKIPIETISRCTNLTLDKIKSIQIR